jgi:hypothetical protein
MLQGTGNDRNCSRTSVNFDVTLIADQSIPFHGTLTNISFNGGYIITHNKALPPKTPLTIVLQQNDGEVQRIYRMTASVVRQDRDGAAITFDDFDADTVRSLRTIYKAALVEA